MLYVLKLCKHIQAMVIFPSLYQVSVRHITVMVQQDPDFGSCTRSSQQSPTKNTKALDIQNAHGKILKTGSLLMNGTKNAVLHYLALFALLIHFQSLIWRETFHLCGLALHSYLIYLDIIHRAASKGREKHT